MEAILKSKREAIQYGFGTLFQKLQHLVDQPVLDLDGHYISASLGESLSHEAIRRLPSLWLSLEAQDSEIVVTYAEKSARD